MTFSDTIALARPEDVGMSRERVARIPEALSAEIDRGRLPGAVSLVARRGRIVHFKAQGWRDHAAGAPMELDAIFRIYSMTKPIVSAALMQLVEEGRLTLADPLSAFIPAFAQVQVARVTGETVELVPPARPITIHDLMRHTSGITYGWISDGPVQRMHNEARVGRGDVDNAEQAEMIARMPLVHQPGAEWHYGRSTDIIGRVVEIVAGRRLGECLSERIFEPLGMVDTGFFVPAGAHSRIAEPFPVDPDSGEPVRLYDITKERPLENAGGGLASTASDYARFLHALANGGRLDGYRLLGPRTIGGMMADHLEPSVPLGDFELLPPGYGFGLGFAVRRREGVAPFPGAVGDAFWQGLGGTSFWIDPQNELYAVLMIQAPGRLEYFRDVFRALVYAALDD